ncbi:MAG: hypothetical protein ACHBN1_10810 [Heteroscytonema crispum UTEX LB 1556]
MLNYSKNKRLTLAALSAIAAILATTPVQALPGQSTNTVLKWVKSRPQLPTLEYGGETSTYFGTKGNLRFFVGTSFGKNVISESIEVSNDSNLKFAQKNTKAVKLIEDIYDSNIANDFKNSRLVTKVGGQHFYQGQKFAYTASDYQGGSGFEIIPVKNLQEAINSAKYCQTNQCDV